MSHEIRVLSLWELKQGATAMQEALKLERERAAYFQSLYDDIGCSRSRFGDSTDEPGTPSSVEAQALNIIDAKAAYDRRIQKKREEQKQAMDDMRQHRANEYSNALYQ